MISAGGSLAHTGGVINVGSGGTLNIYGGTFTQPANGSIVGKGGVIASSGTVNMYGGTIIGGQALDDGETLGTGGNVIISSGVFNMYGGTISGGTASVGSNIYILANGTLNHEGGTIEDKDNTCVKAEA